MAEKTQSEDAANSADVAALVDRFGGARPLAAKLGLSPSTIQRWKDQGRIPPDRHDAILAASDAARLGVTRRDLIGDASIADRELELAAAPAAARASDAAEPAPSAAARPGEDRDQDDNDQDDGDREADRPVAERARRGGGLAAALALLALAVALAALFRPVWTPFVADAPALAGLIVDQPAPPPAPPPPSVAPARVDALEAGARRVAAALAALRARVDETAPPLGDDGQLQAMRDDFDAMRARLDALADRPAAMTSPEPVAPGGALGADPGANIVDAAALDALRDDLTRRIEAVSQAAAAAEAGAAALREELAVALDDRASAAQVDALAAALDDNRNAAAAAADSAAATLRVRLDALADRADEADRATAALAAAQTDAAKAISDLRAASDGVRAARSAAVLFAAGQLRDAALGGQGYAAALDTVATLAAARAPADAVAVLRAQAAGVATRGRLRALFPAVARAAALAAAEAPAPDASLVDRTLARLQAVVVLRPDGAEGASETPSGRIAVAEAALRNEDLAGAVDALSGLSGATASTVADWLELARDRLTVERALGDLTAALIETAALDVSEP